jgi:pyridinium-3,5-bisthiocarboxylic acid mononucleotide nickel chelatase
MERLMSAPTHVHLDPLGGMAGDMFIAAVLDTWPELEPTLDEAVSACGLPEGWGAVHSRRVNGGIEGRHFDVVRPSHDHCSEHHHHAQDSGRYRDIARRIDAMDISSQARAVAQDIYLRLAECEARVHGIDLQDVHFHELADWDSVVDIVGAGTLIAALGTTVQWSVGPIPLGSGLVKTAHGPLPVPAPATARLLEGFDVHDDGVPGERVTPTGAAILAHLAPTSGRVGLRAALGPSGFGLGTREFAGIANVLRVVGFVAHAAVASNAESATYTDTVAVIEFDVDDQSPEDLASGLAHLRASQGVIDVVSRQAFGKKGRHVFEVRVLCDPGKARSVEAACLTHTASLGVRSRLTARRILAREMIKVDSAEGPIDVKLSARPDGAWSAKAEHDQIASINGYAERRALSGTVEAQAVSNKGIADRERNEKND